MATVTGASDAALQQALDKAAATVGGGKKAYIANYMFPEGRTCSGDLKAREIANPRLAQGHPIAMVMPTHPTSTSSITTTTTTITHPHPRPQVLEEMCKIAPSLGAKQAKMLNVSGAFHSPLMQAAQEALSKTLDAVTFLNIEPEPEP